jgi:mutator protein MutT
MPHFHIAIALIWRDGRVLVTRRRDDAEHLPGLWEFPGGKCEDGETPRDCAIRETREETGLDIEIVAERDSIHHAYVQRRVQLYPFDCRIVGGQVQCNASAELHWLLPSELNPEVFPAANNALISDLKQKPLL